MLKKDKLYSAKEIQEMDEEKSTQTLFQGYNEVKKKANKGMKSKRGKSAIEKLGDKLLAKMEESNAKLYEKLHAEIQQVKTELHAEIHSINERLDYIVKANNLKDIPQK